MKQISKNIIFLFLSLLISGAAFSQGGSTVDGATQFCATTGATFTLGTGGTAESGPDYDCLSSQPVPNWFFFRIEQPGSAGSLVLKIFASNDVDYILYGPSSDLASLKTAVKNSTATIQSCSYSSTATEYPTINTSGSTGAYYILLVTNFANTVQTLNMQKSSGTASTDCGFLGFPNVSTISVNVSGVCNGNVTADNGNTITERGFVYSTSNSNPSLSDSKVVAGSAGTGTFSITIPSLVRGSTYYCSAYATNSEGTSYGAMSSFDVPPNEPPVANNDSYKRYYTDTGKPYSVPANGVLGNDTDPDGDPLIVGTPRPATDVTNGNLTLNANGSFSYTPVNGYAGIGTDQFTYYANDGIVNSNSTATVTIYIMTPIFIGGGGNNNFSNPANWNTGYVPNESLDLVIATNRHLDIDVDYTCKMLTFQTGSSFNCINGRVLTITDDIRDHTFKTVIEVNSSIEVRSSIVIPNEPSGGGGGDTAH